MRALIILMVRGYQRISRWLCESRFPLVAWSGCRQYPTCSDYAIATVSTRGVVAGGYLALRRMARCNPLMLS